jgi:hypothetical protein
MVTDQTLRTKGLGNLREANLRFLAMSSAVSARPPPPELGSVSSPLAVHASRVGSDSSFTAWAFAVGGWMVSKASRCLRVPQRPGPLPGSRQACSKEGLASSDPAEVSKAPERARITYVDM